MYDIIIIGGGISGISAAIFSAREKKKTLLIDKGLEHSLVGRMAMVTDYPGLDNASGMELLNRMKKQATELGVEIEASSVTSCTLNEDIKKIVTNKPQTFEAKKVILATGNLPHHDSHVYPGELEFVGKGVSHDIDIDAPACLNLPTAIIGKTAVAAQNVLKLCNYASAVYWIIPASKIDISNELGMQLEKNPKVSMLFSSSLKQINGAGSVNSVSVLSGGQEKNIDVKYIFLPQGQYKPLTDYLGGTGIQMGPDGTIMVSQTLETSLKGVFAAGNILCTKPQATVVCSAQGAVAAMSAIR